jgi:hypothetical protein
MIVKLQEMMNVRSGKFEAFLKYSQFRNKNVATYLMPGLMAPRIVSFRLAVRYGSYMMASPRDLDVLSLFERRSLRMMTLRCDDPYER